ncbi:MAG: hypothetical protein UV20_C0009G0017 [Candidatus Magasanikbacteria bacterium GW2011_GWA2_42_32]|uniref:Uncharacterized protein n=1 Tax=Candidatus Magasanikbacteria bacterium GW2011_GWA2_42_32 TaxID=1619039 RepID=A0A0G1D3G1_9BACT|nr:MAG: hypothetical protein UV20_C0009G0017 [Candidatus Magasanikbacteria bacterium GW2011_GWA2_42_32]
MPFLSKFGWILLVTILLILFAIKSFVFFWILLFIGVIYYINSRYFISKKVKILFKQKTNSYSNSISVLDANRQSMREYIQSGVCKSVAILASIDNKTCKACLDHDAREIPIETPEQIRAAMNCDWTKDCTNEHCRCTIIPITK